MVEVARIELASKGLFIEGPTRVAFVYRPEARPFHSPK